MSAMDERHDHGNTHHSAPAEFVFEMEDRHARDLERATVEVLEQIRSEQGIGWAIYASAFMGRAADNWRVDICEAMR